MGWYYAPGDLNGVACEICQKPMKGKDVSQEEFERPDFKETRDKIVFRDFANNKADHALCVWKQADRE